MKALQFWRRLFSKPNFCQLVIVFIFSLLAARHLFTPGYFIMHDDLQMMRQLQMEKCFLDGQIPCRWVADMGNGYGLPLFNYYPSLPYLSGEIFRLIGFSFVDTVKLLFAVAFLGSGITMYFLCKKFFGKIGGVVGSVFYLWAPYHSVDIYVRGAMNEAWALIFFPLSLLFSYQLISSKEKRSRSIIFLAFGWVGILLSHNLMALIFAPVFATWCLFWLIRLGKIRSVFNKIISLATSGFLALGLTAFFTIPVLLEQKLVHANELISGYYTYSAHFVTTYQLLLDRFWGYGPSIWGQDDGLSFQIGHIHWALSLIAIVVSIYLLIKNRKAEKDTRSIILSILLLAVVGWFAAFMAHSRSTFIWQLFSPLAFVQFPWRFLTLVILAFSFVAAGTVYLFKNRVIKVIALLVCMVLVLLNWNYFRPFNGHNGPLTDEQKFSGLAWDIQRQGGVNDYLPLSAKDDPEFKPLATVEITNGTGEISSIDQGTNWVSFDASVPDRSMQIRVNIYEYPNWRFWIDDNKVEEYVPEDEEFGRMYLDIPQGDHKIYGKLYNTPTRTIGNIISVITWVGLIGFVVWKRKEVFK